MNGTIYDLPPLSRVAFGSLDRPSVPAAVPIRWQARSGWPRPLRTGVISNPRSRHNQRATGAFERRSDVIQAAPATRAELRDVLADWADWGMDLIVIDGGDGTVRDVLTCSGEVWGDRWPAFAVLPSGKTNALAIDLGVPAGWTLDDAMVAAREGNRITRAPIEISRPNEEGAAVRGFLLGAGAFVDATELAQRTHRVGAFNSIAVGLAVGWTLIDTAFGGAESRWRRGTRMAVRFGAGARPRQGAVLDTDGVRYLLLASTLERLPLGLKPLGEERSGLKTLLVDAPLRSPFRRVPAVIAGRDSAALEADGYHRIDASEIEVDLAGSFILDGEIFPGGRYTMRETTPLSFVVP